MGSQARYALILLMRALLAARTLVTALTSNRTLRKLWLGYNCISKVGIDAIVNALDKNSTLKFLSLSGNAIGDVGALALIAKVIQKKNGTLQALWLDGCHIGHAWSNGPGNRPTKK